jgi:hypothetical protein
MPASAPLNAPTAVRPAATMTTSLNIVMLSLNEMQQDEQALRIEYSPPQQILFFKRRHGNLLLREYALDIDMLRRTKMYFSDHSSHKETT